MGGDAKSRNESFPDELDVTELPWPAAARRAFAFSGAAGALFGAAFSVFLAFSGWSPGRSIPLLLIIPVMTGLISGTAGIAGTLVDKVLASRGIGNPALRRVISFSAIASVTFGLAWLGVSRSNGSLQPQATWASLLGLTFGATVVAVEYRFWQVKQEVLRLELENKYLSELAWKDALLAEASKDLLLAEERARVARDLHDSVSSGIHAIVYAVHSLRNALASAGGEPEGSRRIGETLDLLEATALSTQSELRAMILELKPSLLGEKGLAEALRLYCDLFSRRAGIAVEVNVEPAPRLSAEQQVAVYRILQEALSNVERHSGASKVSVSLAGREGEIVLTVSDNGRGFVPTDAGDHAGFGLKNMEARCRENAGILSVRSSPGGGTTIEASFRPLA